jgi:hypothetical protein
MLKQAIILDHRKIYVVSFIILNFLFTFKVNKLYFIHLVSFFFIENIS